MRYSSPNSTPRPAAMSVVASMRVKVAGAEI